MWYTTQGRKISYQMNQMLAVLPDLTKTTAFFTCLCYVYIYFPRFREQAYQLCIVICIDEGKSTLFRLKSDQHRRTSVQEERECGSGNFFRRRIGKKLKAKI